MLRCAYDHIDDTNMSTEYVSFVLHVWSYHFGLGEANEFFVFAFISALYLVRCLLLFVQRENDVCALLLARKVNIFPKRIWKFFR